MEELLKELDKIICALQDMDDTDIFIKDINLHSHLSQSICHLKIVYDELAGYNEWL